MSLPAGTARRLHALQGVQLLVYLDKGTAGDWCCLSIFDQKMLKFCENYVSSESHRRARMPYGGSSDPLRHGDRWRRLVKLTASSKNNVMVLRGRRRDPRGYLHYWRREREQIIRRQLDRLTTVGYRFGML